MDQARSSNSSAGVKNSSVRVDVPESHQVLLSLQNADIAPYDSLSIYIDQQLHVRDEYGDFKPRLFQADEIDVRFASHWDEFTSVGLFRGSGFVAARFRVYFSFHEDSRLPEQLANGTWNCSVSHWPDFRLHFACNLLWDCAAGEDELGCPYTSHECGSLVTAGGSCFR